MKVIRFLKNNKKWQKDIDDREEGCSILHFKQMQWPSQVG